MNNAYKHFKDTRQLATLIFATAAIVLVYEPIAWLIRTWQDPAYDSKGFYIFLICAGMFLWSVTSPLKSNSSNNTRWAFILLAATALIRLAGQVLAVNIIGALALVVDVYALATLTGVQNRVRSISPGWLAVCFLFVLPLERVLQHTVGFALQSISASSSCVILSALFDDVHCAGMRILINNKDVLVDLPCSGARALLLLQLFYAACMAVCQPHLLSGMIGLFISLATAVFVNIFRVMTLAIGIAYPEWFFGTDVMAEPGHSILGLIALGVGCLPIIYWARLAQNTSQNLSLRGTEGDAANQFAYPSGLPRWNFVPPRNDTIKNLVFHIYKIRPIAIALAFLIIAGTIISLPRTPIDVSLPNIKTSLPMMIDNYEGIPSPLLPKEKAYFTQFGGSAVKGSYGENGLLVIKTSSPIRHLHAPDECLRGLGFDVQHVGISYNTVPTAVYKATSVDGESYRIAVTFMSNKGHITSNVSESVWRWMQEPDSVWSAVQRISPWEQEATSTSRWDRAVLAALDINTTQPPVELTKERTQ
jgi:exosortase/archaeosortase family protein